MPMPSPRTACATASEPIRPGSLARPLLLAALALGVGCAAGAEKSEVAPQIRTIFQCELNGKKLTSDRLIPECVHKEQKELNPDGSLKRIHPPTPTADEVAAKEDEDRKAKLKVAAENDAVRRDRNLMHRFPDEAAHRKAREKALDELRIAGKLYADRIAMLMTDRKKLDDEKQFYVNERVNKPLPSQLKQKIDANEASLEAQRSLAQNQVAETERINSLYDAELARLRKLWAGAQPGSFGPLPQQGAATAKPLLAPAAISANTPDAAGKATLK